VQGLELILMSAGILVGVAYVATQMARNGASNHPLGRLLLGVIPAVIAVALILIDRLDVVPDDMEQPIWLVAVVLISLGLVLATSYRLARR
jgi:hypothetical protein